MPQLGSQFPGVSFIKEIADIEGEQMESCNEARIWFYIYRISDFLFSYTSNKEKHDIDQETKDKLIRILIGKQEKLVKEISSELIKSGTVESFYKISNLARKLSQASDLEQFNIMSRDSYFSSITANLHQLGENWEIESKNLLVLMGGFFF